MRRLAGSFRDPSGFVYQKDGVLLRQVNPVYGPTYERLLSSGLYDLLVEHREVDPATWGASHQAYKVLQPERVPFVSYPAEWCFSQLQDAALATLRIQRLALDNGLSLKDASAFNIQFLRGRPVFIDTLSFEVYEPGAPWVAYRQFCQHFLAPLALMAYRDVRLQGLLKHYIDGVPLDLASRLLPRRTLGRLGLAMHLHLHGRKQRQYEGRSEGVERAQVKESALRAILESLESSIAKLEWAPAGTEWADYYDHTNYTDRALEAKKVTVDAFVRRAAPKTAWDLGANTGVFSRVASSHGAQVVSFDVDPAAVEQNYRTVKERGETAVLPLLLDLTNPQPAMGWAHTERSSWAERGPVDMVLALALIHHLAISNNVPLDSVAELFARVGEWLAIEFVPKSDSQVERLLATREDVFPEYTREGFEAAFEPYFEILERQPVAESERCLYLMRRRGTAA